MELAILGFDAAIAVQLTTLHLASDGARPSMGQVMHAVGEAKQRVLRTIKGE